MGSIFSKGEEHLNRMFEISSVPVVYKRNGNTLVSSLLAKIGKTVFRTNDYSGMAVRTESRDFIVRRSELDCDPEKGDEIEWEGKLYRVTAPSGEPCWKWHTRQSHTQMRIHTTEAGDVEEEEAPDEQD